MTGIQILNSKETTLGNGLVLNVGDEITIIIEINYFFSESTSPIGFFFKDQLIVYRDDLFKLI